MSEKNLIPLDVNSIALVPGADIGFHHPSEVVADTRLTKDRKRAILASWASDAHSLENAPGLRQLGSGAIVSLADILTALNALDDGDLGYPDAQASFYRQRLSRHSPAHLGASLWSGKNDNDDDPPPSPAAAQIPRLYFKVNAQAA